MSRLAELIDHLLTEAPLTVDDLFRQLAPLAPTECAGGPRWLEAWLERQPEVRRVGDRFALAEDTAGQESGRAGNKRQPTRSEVDPAIADRYVALDLETKPGSPRGLRPRDHRDRGGVGGRG